MNENKTLGFIPEFYSDIIARLIPGFVIVSVYGFDRLSDNLNVQKIALGMILSYISGFVMSILSNILWNRIFFMRSAIRKIVYGSRSYYAMSEIWKIFRLEINEIHHARFTKMIAEFYMFRSLTLISIVFICYQPKMFRVCSLFELIALGIISFLIFTACMLSTYIGICGSIDTLRDKKNNL